MSDESLDVSNTDVSFDVLDSLVSSLNDFTNMFPESNTMINPSALFNRCVPAATHLLPKIPRIIQGQVRVPIQRISKKQIQEINIKNVKIPDELISIEVPTQPLTVGQIQFTDVTTLDIQQKPSEIDESSVIDANVTANVVELLKTDGLNLGKNILRRITDIRRQRSKGANLEELKQLANRLKITETKTTKKSRLAQIIKDYMKEYYKIDIDRLQDEMGEPDVAPE